MLAIDQSLYYDFDVFYFILVGRPFKSLGCWADRRHRAIPTMEGMSHILRGNYGTRRNAVKKCYQAAKAKGFKCFAVQNGGRCFAGWNACYTYGLYGRSNKCRRGGKGGVAANNVYKIPGECSLHVMHVISILIHKCKCVAQIYMPNESCSLN